MADQAPLTVIRSYGDLHTGLRARFAALGLTREQVDGLAGLTEGHANKLLAPYPRKALGRVSMGPVLAAAACEIWLVERPELLSTIADLGTVRFRASSDVKPLDKNLGNLPERRTIQRGLMREAMRKNGRKGGRASVKARAALTPAQRTRIAKRAWRTRRRNARLLKS